MDAHEAQLSCVRVLQERLRQLRVQHNTVALSCQNSAKNNRSSRLKMNLSGGEFLIVLICPNFLSLLDVLMLNIGYSELTVYLSINSVFL